MALAPKFARIVEEAAQEAKNARRYVAANRIRNPPQTVGDPLRNEYPLVYAPANVIRRMADENNTEESPWLPKIFGVTRAELDQMSGDPARIAQAIPAVMPGMPANPKGARFAEQLNTPQNYRRLVDQLTALQGSKIGPGMRGWYVMDPAYHLLLEHTGGDTVRAAELYNRFNVSTGVMSPGSDVMTEIARGGNANWLANQGRLQDFINLDKYLSEGSVPEDMAHIPGHAYHSTAHSAPLGEFFKRGQFDPFRAPMGSPKVPGYMQASGVPQIGFQVNWPVGDAHFARGLGFADIRPNKNPTFNRYANKFLEPNYGASLSNPESYTAKQFFAPIAAEVGLTPVQGQGLLWGGLAPATGVTTSVGVPKLELIANYIGESVMPRNRITDPRLAGKRFLAGEIGSIDPALAAATAVGAGAGLAGYREYERRRKPKFLDLIPARR